jgi:hypothetical protein
VNSDSLSLTFAAGGSLTGSGSLSSIAALNSGTSGGLVFNGTSIGANQLGTFSIAGINTTNGTLNGTVAVNVYDHASPLSTGSSFALPDVIVGYSGAIAASNTLSLSNASGYRSNLKTTGALTSGSVTLNALNGLIAGGAPGSVSASLAQGQAVGAFTQNFALTFADDSLLRGASVDLGTWNIAASGTKPK